MSKMKRNGSVFVQLLLAAVFFAPGQSPVWAQITSAPDGTNTGVNQAGNAFNITGGTQAGSNLFHSFQRFGLNAGQIANFLSNPAIANILGRVTGGEASIINGRIQVTGSNANLFLMNPAGIIFGANASLNVPGSFTATTANAIGFRPGITGVPSQWFNATGVNNYSALVGEPNAFVFSALQPGAIINAGNLAVGTGQNLTLLGGTVVSTGTLAAPGGTVTVATVPGNQYVRVGQAGSVLSYDLPLAVKNTVNPLTTPPLSLPQLLTGGTLTNATGLTVANGVVTLTGLGIPVSAGDVVAKNVTAATATLSAAKNLTLVESQLRTTGDLNLLAKNTVTVRDSVATPVTIKSGKNLTIQGNQGIDILALNHAQPAFQSVGNLSMISDGIISGDAHYASGSFSIRKLDGTPGTFISLYDPIISANGDVTFGNYTGVSLKVEATGNITTGNIEITGPDPIFAAAPVGSDRRILGDYRAVILRAGVPVLEETAFATNPNPNPPFSIPAAGTLFNGSAPSASGGRVTVGNPANLSVPSIRAEYIDISAPNGILINGPVDTNYVKLTSTSGDVVVHSIRSSSDFGALSGDIDITAGKLFKATGTLDSLTGFDVGFRTGLENYSEVDSTLVPFLVHKTGSTTANVVNTIVNSSEFTEQAIVNTPISISSFLGDITIRYAGGGAGTTLTPGVTLQGGDAPFTIGANVFAGGGDPFIPANPADNFSTFVANPFSLVKNETYSLATIPDNESGTVGAIIRTITGDGSLTVSVQNRVIGIRPTPTPVPEVQTPTQVQTTAQAEAPGNTVSSPRNTVSSTAQQTVQRTFVQRQDSECAATSSNSISENTGRSPNSSSTNPCTSTSDEAQILKILGEDAKPNQSNYFIHPSVELAGLLRLVEQRSQ
ncbi:filamentous hemagglutinin N-terminal domain-containing protein [Phormidium sp. CLA17]|uniref:two-partner secretion domain-containing protein n=1 Tax=Leptolyngbya sp. Cla-17 TaxID=2803751 RepID=UPI00149119DE|nr:filamentous hemagglutinin N-terminal domain-containing protein [Leptolyngbya sp. Cla-17]MBM0743473.1 filamentous hemagglutinin N-terminal domain-containing protein [Leptolyngbya sp. Cla-17]